MKITDYDLVSALDADDVFLIDGARGTKIINQSNVVRESKILKVIIPSMTSSSITVADQRITSDMIVVNSILSNPAAQIGVWTVTTGDGTVTVSGTISGSTDVTLYLEKCINPNE